MGVLFGFGAAQILQIVLGEYLREDVHDLFGGQHVVQPRPGFVVLRHRNEEEIFRTAHVGKFLKSRLGDGARHLAGAVGAKIEKNDRIIITNRPNRRSRRRGAFRDRDGVDEFVGDAPFVAAPHGFDWISRSYRSIAVNHGAISALDALPAVIAIHGVVAPGERCNPPASDLAYFLLQLLDKIHAAMRRRVAAVHKAVDKHALNTLLSRHPQKRKKMLYVRVHASIAQQAEEMQIALAAAFHGLDEQRLHEKLLVSRSSDRCA